MYAPYGQIPQRYAIQSVTNSNPCVVTTFENHGYFTFDFVRITDLDGYIPVPRGMDELNDNRYRIIVTGLTTFYLQDPITFEPIDSTNYPPYVTGGSVNKVATTFFFYGGCGNGQN
jgi:hypothetical protein